MLESPKNPVFRMPTVRQARFVEGLTDGKSARSAALDAGYSESSADHATTEILPVVQRAFGDVIRNVISVERLVQRLDEGLDAVDVKVATFEGKITDQRAFVDYGQRRAYVELIVKLGSHFVSPSRDESPESPLSVEDVREEIKRKLLGRNYDSCGPGAD
jgi:hypothetical protein